MSEDNVEKTPAFSWAVPKELGIPVDPLRLRLDFHHQATMMTTFQGEIVTTKLVDAMDVAHALANEMTFGSGILPQDAVWWQNTRTGPQFAIYEPPKIRRLALQTDIHKAPLRLNVPLPAFLFICSPSVAPYVFAVKRRPTKPTDALYHAPLANVFRNGRSCPGSHEYPSDVGKMVESFFISFFSPTADLRDRSKKHPDNIIKLWKELAGKKKFPVEDLVAAGTVADLLGTRSVEE